MQVSPNPYCETQLGSNVKLKSSILRELGYVKRKEPGGDTIRQFMTGEDSDEVLACYRRIQGYLQRLSVRYIPPTKRLISII